MQEAIKRSGNRVFLIDYLKGIAIFLVVWGHAIEYAPHDGYDFFINPVYIFIYSFHMPLFMFISGYLFLYSMKDKDFWNISKNKFLQLIVPLIIWSFIYYFFRFVLGFYDIKDLTLLEKAGLLFYRYITSFPYELWFLWAVFFCSIIMAACKTFFKNKIYSYIAVFIVLLLIPDTHNLHMLKFTYPYFVLGYFYNKEKEHFQKYLKYFLAFSFVMFPILLMFWNRDYYVYITGMDLYVQNLGYKIFVILYRYLIGLVGIVFIVQIVKWTLKLGKLNFITYMGRETMGIYIISSDIIMLIFSKIPLNVDNLDAYNFIFTPLLSIAVILICFLLIKLLEKNRYTNRIFLGER